MWEASEVTSIPWMPDWLYHERVGPGSHTCLWSQVYMCSNLTILFFISSTVFVTQVNDYFRLNDLRKHWLNNFSSLANRSPPSTRDRYSTCFQVGSFRVPSLSLNTGNLPPRSFFSRHLHFHLSTKDTIWREQVHGRILWFTGEV